jgi:hypothetical protein
MSPVLLFLIGLWIGAACGFFVAALLRSAHHADVEWHERLSDWDGGSGPYDEVRIDDGTKSDGQIWVTRIRRGPSDQRREDTPI